MDDVYLFQTIQYRNGLFQGLTRQFLPQGIGLFFDDDSALYCSIWKAGKVNGRTAIFISQGKYFYGEWKDNKPHGFNVFRSGDIILLGNYVNGELTGRFVIIFEKQNFIIVVNNMNEIKENVEKKYFKDEIQLKHLANKCFQAVVRVDDYFQFIFYLKNSFCLEHKIVKLQFKEGDLKFGFHRGLGVVFDDNNFVRKQGYLDHESRLCGLGASFGIVHEEGNFETGEVVKYNVGNKPVEKVRNLFKRGHIRSIFYRNDFIPLKTDVLTALLDSTLKSVINKIVQLPNSKILSSDKPSPHNHHNQSLQQLNDSLQYHPKRIIDNGDRIKKMRLQLDLSAGKVGSQIKSPFIKYQDNIRNEFKQLYFTPLVATEYLEPEGIRFNKPENNLPYVQNRQVWMEQNRLMEYRRMRYDQGLYSPNSSRYEEEKERERKKSTERGREGYLDKQAIVKRDQKERQKKQPSYVKKNRQKDKLIDQQNQFIQKQQRQYQLKLQLQLKQQQDLIRQKSKQKQLYQEITKQIEKEKEKQNELTRERQITFAIQKQVDELPKFINKLNLEEIKNKSSQVTPKSSMMKADAPVQTSFQYQYQQGENMEDDINKFSQEKSTAVKPQNIHQHQIHYNPFLRTFVSSKYPPLVNGQEGFKKVQIVPNLKQLNLRPTVNSQELDDSLDNIKDIQLTEYRPPRYLIQGKTSPNDTDRERYPANIPTPKKKSSYTPASFSPQNKLKQALQQSLTRDKSKSYLQIYKTSATHVDKDPPRTNSKSPLIRNPSYNKLKRPQSPYTPSTNKQRQQVNQKIIEIQHQRTSPQGKKTTSFERIIKKYHYISQKA